MADWPDINRQIQRCLASAEPIPRLQELFGRTQDGHVAFALAQALEADGRHHDARAMYEAAEKLYGLPRYQAKARACANRLGLQGHAGALTKVSEASKTDVLYVINCTKAKVWELNPAAPKFVAARDAYRGDVCGWRESEAYLTGKPWLFLSAKYGFIEPDHPISDYNVTFSAPETGPISGDSLKQQAFHQPRVLNGSARLLTSFKEVVVYGHAGYLDKVTTALAGSGVRVRSAETSPSREAGQARVNRGHARDLGLILARIPTEVWESIDRAEPESEVIRELGEQPDPYGLLAVLCLGLSDYQLASGGAEKYWAEAREVLSGRKLRSIPDVLDAMESVLSGSASKRLTETKRTRVRKLLHSSLGSELGGLTFESLDLMWLWKRLSETMAQDPSIRR